MFKLLFLIILFIGFLILILGASFLRLLRDLFLGRPQQPRGTQGQGRAQQRSQQRQQDYQRAAPTQKSKIINKDEGEYVDYEEVK